MQVVYSLLNYLPLRSVETLTLTSKYIREIILSSTGLGILKAKVCCPKAKSACALFTSSYRAKELEHAIRREDAYAVLSILCPGMDLIPVLNIAVKARSNQVFAAVCSMEAVQAIEQFNLDDLVINVLRTCDPVMYEYAFSHLSDYMPGELGLVCYCSYFHSLMTGDTRAYDVVKRYGYPEVDVALELKAIGVLFSIPYLKWLLDRGYTKKQLLKSICTIPSVMLAYLTDVMTYKEALEESESFDEQFIRIYRKQIAHLDQL